MVCKRTTHLRAMAQGVVQQTSAHSKQQGRTNATGTKHRFAALSLSHHQSASFSKAHWPTESTDYQYTQLYSLTTDLPTQRSITLPQHLQSLLSFFKGTMAISWIWRHYWRAVNWEPWHAIINQALPPMQDANAASEDRIKQQEVYGR